MKRLFSVLVLLLSLSQVNATHIIGGEFYATHVADSLFEFNLILYRDFCNGNDITDNPIPITVYENGGSTVLFTFDMPFIDEQILELGDNCFSPTVCVEQKNYRVTVPLPDNPNGLYFAWERCCRNAIITNVDTPDDWGMVFTFSMPDPALQNSSPFFENYPTNAYFCAGGSNQISFAATDLDGDSLAYFLDDPRAGAANIGNVNPAIASPAPYMAVPWAAGFSSANMVGGTPPLAIDPVTANLTANPDMLGVYVFAVLVEEYRDGVKIGEVRRELQFDTFICPEDSPSEITWSENSSEQFIIEPNKPFCIDVVAQDENLGDTLFLFANSPILDTAFTPQAAFVAVEGNGEVTTQFCWTPDCDALSPIPYEVTISAFSSGCSDTSFTAVEEFSIIVELPEDTPTELVFPLNNEIEYVMNGEQHCFDAVLSDVDCYDTLTFYVDSTRYIFNGSPSPGTFSPTPPSLFGAIGEFCWTPVCEDINEDDNFYALDFMVDSRKCNTVNTYTYPFGIRILPETDGLIQLPNVFTPNDDDTSNRDFLAHNNLTNLLPPDFCIENFTITIYNRWGAEVFASTDKFFEWDGMHFNTEEPCSPGVYYYIINYDVFGRSETYTGDITLIR